MNTILITGFLLGFLGSFHCVVMCGPVILSLPDKSNSKFNFILGRIIYNSGRISVYAFLGLILGIVGERIYLAGFQQMFSIFTGVIILLLLIKQFIWKRKNKKIVQISTRKYTFIKEHLGRLYARRTKFSLLVLGMMNGFLPCGFVYIALTASASFGSSYKGAAFMLLFGLGTIPLLLVLSLTGSSLKGNFRRTINKYSPVFAAILALIFIIRGLNLGIPYLSPKMEFAKANSEAVICH